MTSAFEASPGTLEEAEEWARDVLDQPGRWRYALATDGYWDKLHQRFIGRNVVERIRA